jgi:hypothetical protein
MSRPISGWQWAGEVLILLALLGSAALLAEGVCGCGAGALGAHARAASIAVLALQGADDLAETSALVAVAACSDEACMAEVAHATEAIDASIGSAALAVSAYVEAVRLAVIGGESPDLLSALMLGVLRLLREWGRLAALYAPLGVDLPALPASVTGLGGAL